MTITVNLTPMEEAQLSSEAIQNGLDTSELVQNLLREHLISTPLTSADKVRIKLRQWQKETKTVTSPAIPAHELFARWAEEDAQMTEEEMEAEDRLWEDFQKGINETRAALSMSPL